MCDWADNAVRELSEKKGSITQKEAAELLRRHASAPLPDSVDDESWLAHLASLPKYAGLDINSELQSCKTWGAKNGQTMGRRRFLAWLDKAERPINGILRMRLPEPPNWRERLVAEHPTCAYAPGGLRANDTWGSMSREDQQFIIEQLKLIPA